LTSQQQVKTSVYSHHSCLTKSKTQQLLGGKLTVSQPKPGQGGTKSPASRALQPYRCTRLLLRITGLADPPRMIQEIRGSGNQTPVSRVCIPPLCASWSYRPQVHKRGKGGGKKKQLKNIWHQLLNTKSWD